MVTVKDMMTPVSSFAGEQDKLADVVATMRANQHSCAVITRDGKVQGILTERDLAAELARALSRGEIRDSPVAAVMSVNPVCVREDASLLDAINLARSHHVRHLPVINQQDQLVGMVTHTDMINLYVAILEQQSALVDANIELQAQSREDPLLQIGNRRAMETDLARVAAAAQRSQQSYSIALLDLDFFKPFNDHYGHVAGDYALQSVVAAIKKNMRQGDSLYRYGGEELLLLMPGSDLDGASYAAERARQEVEGLSVSHLKSPYEKLTISGGVANAGDFSFSDLIALADKALYCAKAQGRNKICRAER